MAEGVSLNLRSLVEAVTVNLSHMAAVAVTISPLQSIHLVLKSSEELAPPRLEVSLPERLLSQKALNSTNTTKRPHISERVRPTV
jgi:hypothetical protein